jgi:hypothetical protein
VYPQLSRGSSTYLHVTIIHETDCYGNHHRVALGIGLKAGAFPPCESTSFTYVPVTSSMSATVADVPSICVLPLPRHRFQSGFNRLRLLNRDFNRTLKIQWASGQSDSAASRLNSRVG